MTDLESGVPTRIAECETPVYRILGRNPGPMTGLGTNSYLIGNKRLALVDPGPLDEIQLTNFLAAIGERRLEWILITHTHGDHSPAAMQLKAQTGAELVGLEPPVSGHHDRTFKPDRVWPDGSELDCGEYTIQLIHTPGHVSNHICYLLQADQLLFTGDHILQGTTSVILPPDGDMGAYLKSLASLKNRSLKYLAPGHGGLMIDPHGQITKLIRHRLQREHKVLHSLRMLGSVELDSLVLTVYDDVAEHLLPWAKKNLLAHLIKLQQEKRVRLSGASWEILGHNT